MKTIRWQVRKIELNSDYIVIKADGRIIFTFDTDGRNQSDTNDIASWLEDVEDWMDLYQEGDKPPRPVSIYTDDNAIIRLCVTKDNKHVELSALRQPKGSQRVKKMILDKKGYRSLMRALPD